MSRYIKHHGIKGQKWGVRRFQKKDGSLTPEGKKRYDNDGDNRGETKGKTTGAASKGPSAKDVKVANASKKYLKDDGSLTKEGKDKFGNKENMQKQLKKQADLDELNSAIELNNAAKNLAGKGQQRASEKRRQEQAALDDELRSLLREKAVGMSDKELRDIANRLELENRYVRAVSERERIEVGRSKAEKFYDVASSTLMITGMALGVAVKIKQLQG